MLFRSVAKKSFIGFFVLILLQVLVKAFYYDAKVQSNMQENQKEFTNEIREEIREN